MIPFYRPLYEDEFYYGWQVALADMNGLTPNEFRQAYFNPDKEHFSVDNIRSLRIDYPIALRMNLKKHPKQLPDADTILRKHSLVYELSPFISLTEQAGLINDVFNAYVGNSYNTTASIH